MHDAKRSLGEKGKVNTSQADEKDENEQNCHDANERKPAAKNGFVVHILAMNKETKSKFDIVPASVHEIQTIQSIIHVIMTVVPVCILNGKENKQTKNHEINTKNMLMLKMQDKREQVVLIIQQSMIDTRIHNKRKEDRERERAEKGKET